MASTSCVRRYLFISMLVFSNFWNGGNAFNCMPHLRRSLSSLPSRPDPTMDDDRTFSSRRSFIGRSTMPLLTAASIFPPGAWAAAPISVKDTENVGARFERARHPKPPKMLRRKLSQDFAVLLMRSSYAVLDDLDCIAMVRVCRSFKHLGRSF